MKDTWLKDPDATLDYTVDWSLWLDAGDTITGVDVEVDDDLDIESSSNTTSTVTAWVSGGDVDIAATRRVRFRITTANGRIDDRSIFLTILHR